VGNRYRVWIVRCDREGPGDWRQPPPGAVAVEPAEPGTMTARQARLYVEAFNGMAAGGLRKTWAVAMPVMVRYVGEPQPGALL
jgi:hypothetical protein